MRIDAWIMLIIGCSILYGGLGYCLYTAWKNRGKYEPEDDETSE